MNQKLKTRPIAVENRGQMRGIHPELRGKTKFKVVEERGAWRWLLVWVILSDGDSHLISQGGWRA